MRIILAGAIAIWSSCAASTLAADADTEIFRNITNINSRASNPSPEERKKLADSIVVYWQDFDSRVPRNSPAAGDWLIKELSTTDMTRIRRATSTIEYALLKLGDLADGCVSDAKLVQASVGTDPLRELYAWVRLSDCYNDPTDVERHMIKAGVSKDRFEGPLTMAHATMLHRFIAGRIANAVVSGR